MKGFKRGFTLVEVSLFLAITAAVFVGIAIGTQNSIFQQRYNDSVQSFAEFLRTVYSQVKNVQNGEGRGNSNQAIYGKLVTFGEEDDFNGYSNTKNAIFTYNVIGNVSGPESGDIMEQLASLGANVVYANDSGEYEFAGYNESYVPRWGAEIQTTAGWNGTSYQDFKGALLIVRHPSSGVVYTKVLTGTDTTVEVNKTIKNASGGGGQAVVTAVQGVLQSALNSFETKVVDFCVNPNGNERSALRRDVRLAKGLRNASGIQIIADEREVVLEDGTFENAGGNRCAL